ncbi:MAG: metallophosphoesterase [Balneolales bacterium]
MTHLKLYITFRLISLIFITGFFISSLVANPGVKTRISASEVADDTELTIWVPRQHNPEFVEPGGVFSVELKGASDLDKDGWTVSVHNDLKSWSASVESTEWGFIQLDTEEGWRLKVSIPNDISPELMELKIQHTSGLESSSRRSVHIVPDFEEDFYILQQTDQHITNEKAVVPSGKASAKWGNGSMEALQWITESVNLANPRFLLDTGDNSHVYNEKDSWAGIEEASLRVARFYEGMAGYTVPSVVTSGNHDTGWETYVQFDEWRERYKREMGQTAFSFRMGSFYVLSSEWPLEEYYDWMLSDYTKAGEDTTVDFRLIVSHHFDGLDAGATVAREDNPADLMLQGHTHRTFVVMTEPYPVLSVQTAQDYQRAAFYDFKRTKNGWTSPEVATHANEVNVHRMVGDWGESKLWAEYSQPNDGTARSNVVEINNTLPHNFYDGRIRFLMVNDREYSVRGGDILSQYEYDKGKKIAFVVKVNIPENGNLKVEIK